MTRTEASFHHFGHGTDVEGTLVFLGVDRADFGSEERTGTYRSQKCAIGFECAWVGLEVSRIVELRGVDEDADDTAITFAECTLDEA